MRDLEVSSPSSDISSSQMNPLKKDPQVGELAGNPIIGSVEVVLQIHSLPGGGCLPAIRQHTGRYQAEILKRFISQRPSVIFCEGLTQNITPNHPQRNELLSTEAIKRAFPGGPKGVLEALKNPTREQLEILEKHGATDVYAALINPQVLLHRTTDVVFEKNVDKLLADGDSSNDKFAIYKYREERLAKEVREYLARYPGAKVVVVYGRSHKDIPALLNQRGAGPQVSSIDWPVLESQHVNNQSSQVSAERDAQLQTRLIRQAHALYETSFPSIKTEDGQMAALRKLAIDVTSPLTPSPEALRQYLLSSSVSPNVKKEIERLYNEYKKGNYPSSGPFAAFDPFEISERLFNAYDPKLQRLLVRHSTALYSYAVSEALPSDVQKLAIQKIQRLDEGSREEIKKYLLEVFSDPEMRKFIHRLYKERKAPFK